MLPCTYELPQANCVTIRDYLYLLRYVGQSIKRIQSETSTVISIKTRLMVDCHVLNINIPKWKLQNDHNINHPPKWTSVDKKIPTDIFG